MLDRTRPAAVLAAWVLACSPAAAATLRGTVRDSAGHPLPGVVVLAWQHGGGFQTTATSGPDGVFEAWLPDHATYNLAANKPDVAGHRPDVSTGTADNVPAGAGVVVVNFDLDAPQPPPPAVVHAPRARTPFAARLLGVRYARRVAPRQRFQAVLELANAGGAAWDEATRVGLSNERFAEPGRGGLSPFEAPGWIAFDRLATTGPVPPGGRTEVTLELVAPATPGSHAVHLELVQEAVAWFDGPGDDCTLRVDVEAPPAAGGSARVLGADRGRHAPSSVADRLGVDVNAPLDAQGAVLVDLDAVAGTGARWARVNFLAGPWSDPEDARRFGGRTWFEAFDEVVDGLRARGLSVYGLINTEALAGGADALRGRGDPDGARAYVEAYARAVVAIVERYRGRVGAFELVNEPNDWAGGGEARVHPTWLALALRRCYEAVKLDRGWWDVTLVSGPLFSHRDDLADDYLRDVYHAGRAEHGWDALRAAAGRYPLDGVGYHVYVLEDPDDRPAQVAWTYRRHLDAIEAVLLSEDPDAWAKRLWVSEVGWRSLHGEDHQADMLEAGLRALAADPRVALAVGFCLTDWERDGYGLRREDGAPKAALDRFRRLAGGGAP